jgi:transcriptional regulator with XRE-family HTH domain
MKLAAYLHTVGLTIKAARVRAGLRQIDVNERTGLTYRHYQNIEAGKVNVTVGTLCRLARLFKLSIKDLLHECED